LAMAPTIYVRQIIK